MADKFMKSALKGFNAKLITEAVFRDSKSYETYPFGYESSFSRLVQNLDENIKSDTNLQLRSMPDLLVFDSEKKNAYLVECKYRNIKKLSNLRLNKSSIERYQKYWKDCILVIIVPMGEYLYAQYIDKLNISNKKIYGDNIYFDIEKEFLSFIEIFHKVDKRVIDKYKTFIETISGRED